LGIKMPNVGIKIEHAVRKKSRGVEEAPARYTVAEKSGHSLADALFTTTQQRVLGALFGQPQRSFTVTELIALTGAGSGAAQRELARLTASGLLTVRPIGNQKHYQANPASPIHDELVGIMQKTVGFADPLRQALAPLAKKIAAAFVYGSVARRNDTAVSDIDLMIVSDELGYADVMLALHSMQERLGREINPTIYSRSELAKRVRNRNAFVRNVLAQPKLWLIGGENDLGT
jgi:predicted nucleotidyltransferase